MKTKVISVRLEKELYEVMEKQADKKKESIAQYLRGILYSYHYPTGEIVSRLEENKNKLDSSIENTREYLQELIDYSNSLQEAMKDFEKKIEGGAIQFPLKEREAIGET